MGNKITASLVFGYVLRNDPQLYSASQLQLDIKDALYPGVPLRNIEHHCIAREYQYYQNREPAARGYREDRNILFGVEFADSSFPALITIPNLEEYVELYGSKLLAFKNRLQLPTTYPNPYFFLSLHEHFLAFHQG